MTATLNVNVCKCGSTTTIEKGKVRCANFDWIIATWGKDGWRDHSLSGRHGPVAYEEGTQGND